jgi:hypothetical protein
MLKLPNSNVRNAVQRRLEFKNTNGTLFGRWETPNLYVVYSYGEHFPLFLCDGMLNMAWAMNTDKYSVTTSKHFSQAHPRYETVASNTEEMKAYIRKASKLRPLHWRCDV